ncbi:MAG: hypothetical protein IJ844_07805 [Prevotella sp.]|nr:hypothetical protein [Prevotella sp.]
MPPYTDEYNTLVRELFGTNLGEGGWIMPGLSGVCFDKVRISNNVIIMNNCLMMGRGGITLDDQCEEIVSRRMANEVLPNGEQITMSICKL